MQVSYKVISTFLPGKGTSGKRIWFPKLTGSSQVDLRGICKSIEKRTSFSGADTVGVLYAFRELIPELLCDGKTVKIDGLGTFRLHARVATSDTEEKVTSRNIKEFRLSFKPDKIMKQMLQNTTAYKV